MRKLADLIEDIWWWRFKRIHLNPKIRDGRFKKIRKIKKASKGDMSDERNIQGKRD